MAEKSKYEVVGRVTATEPVIQVPDSEEVLDLYQAMALLLNEVATIKEYLIGRK